MRELNENEIEMVSGGGDGDHVGASIVCAAPTGMVATAAVIALSSTPVGWAVAAGVGVWALGSWGLNEYANSLAA